MSKKNDQNDYLLRGLQKLAKDQEGLDFRDFREVSNNLLQGYAKFCMRGFPSRTIALAMLGATINLYQMLGMDEELPDMFRSLADSLESTDDRH